MSRNIPERTAVVDLIHRVFRDHHVSRDVIDRSVWPGDPGAWTDGGAIYTLTTENGLPNPNYEDYTLWCELNDPLAAVGLWFEIINCAIVALYPVEGS